MPSSGNSVDRMKHLLSSGEHSDVHFLVGYGDAQEVLPAHQLVLRNASEVFDAMFRFDSKNEQAVNASANCPAVVEVPDVEPAAFKVMLSFVYADDLSELNGDNAMEVLYAAKKYNIPGLFGAPLQIPISELRNIFMAYAQALLFELDDFVSECLWYICQNAARLFKSTDFLQIDQEMLCYFFERDQLLISNEFELWKAALRWADEKCRQNGVECSPENLRAVLGPALFKIHLPNIHEADFSKYVVPYGILTMEEVISVYQFNAQPFLYFRGVSKQLYSLKFPSHGRISGWNIAKRNRRGTLAFEIENLAEFSGKNVGSSRFSDVVYINGLAWRIEAEVRKKTEGTTDVKCLGIYLRCDTKEGEHWPCVCSATFRIVSKKSKATNSIGTRCDCVFNNLRIFGFGNFITFAELMDPKNGFYEKNVDKVTLAIDVTLNDEKTQEKFISDPNKSGETLSMEIDNLSEFEREVIGSERRSETWHIKGFSWKTLAKIEKKNENTDEKWLSFYILCNAPKEDKNWSCKCSAIFQIMSQKSGMDDYKKELASEETFNNKAISRGFPNFISFAELMDPSKGLYNQNEDKVKLAIDVTVK
ncbi:hypothetical protein niasHT_033363 [Heterodera trifolii]|uniref:BTB/POZ domain-containing protein n=1 Tax=Heterodera trifolii TaxID=157864 RepID=A0ABD2I2K4_9BILA